MENHVYAQLQERTDFYVYDWAPFLLWSIPTIKSFDKQWNIRNGDCVFADYENQKKNKFDDAYCLYNFYPTKN